MNNNNFIKRWKPFWHGKKLFYIVDIQRYTYAKDIQHCEARFTPHKNIVPKDLISTLKYLIFGNC